MSDLRGDFLLRTLSSFSIRSVCRNHNREKCRCWLPSGVLIENKLCYWSASVRGNDALSENWQWEQPCACGHCTGALQAAAGSSGWQGPWGARAVPWGWCWRRPRGAPLQPVQREWPAWQPAPAHRSAGHPGGGGIKNRGIWQWLRDQDTPSAVPLWIQVLPRPLLKSVLCPAVLPSHGPGLGAQSRPAVSIQTAPGVLLTLQGQPEPNDKVQAISCLSWAMKLP